MSDVVQVAVTLASDPFDDRPGPWFSNADLHKLASLPPGTALYIRPSSINAVFKPLRSDKK